MADSSSQKAQAIFDYKERFELLNPQQQEAVLHNDGPCALVAVPGAGKTMVLTMHVHRLVKEEGVGSNRILACTFTNKAASEMKERVLGSLNDHHAWFPWIGTMHSLFFRMLHDSPKHTTRVKGRIPIVSRYFNFQKYMNEAAKGFGDRQKDLDVRGILNAISHAKNNLMSPEEYRIDWIERHGNISDPAGPGCSGNKWDYYREYERLKEEDGAVDFDDMIYQTFRMFEENPDILKKWQGKFDHILVDEFQDINMAQWEVVKMLSAEHRQLFVVGDGNQSIYQFRGSKPEFLFEIDNDVPDVKQVTMTTNYRSADQIIDLANKILNVSEYYVADIEGTGKDGSVEYTGYPDPTVEAQAVADEIKALVEQGVDPNDIGVIYRLNIQASSLQIALWRNGIKFSCKEEDGFWGSKIVKDFIAYLEAATTEDCESSLSRILNTPNRYLGGAFKTAWSEVMAKYEADPKKALTMAYRLPYWERNAKELSHHLGVIQSLEYSRDAIQYIRYQVGYGDYITKNGEELDPSIESMMDELEFKAEEYPAMQDLISVANSIRSSGQSEGAVPLMTIHGAKGLEFDHVFFVGLIDGIIPHRLSMNPSGITEERNMFFVGATRAKTYLHLSASVSSPHAGKKSKKKREKNEKLAVSPSRFLTEAGVKGV